ncbi:MAG: hypothetical protein HDR24_14050 [Lachnospiraceae bacterium]|nr:hypothetical protein [Lachnospiraceae bacterium]
MEGRQEGKRRGRCARVSGLVFKSDFTNGMDVGVARRTGRSRRHPALWLLKSPSMAIFPWAFTIP